MSINQQGVTYIKINRIDNEGNDNTLTLQGLTNIRIKYSDIGVKDYPIYTIAEYPNYYLYQLYTTDVTSSTDNSILNYTLNVTTGSQTFGGTGLFFSDFPIGNINTDSTGYYNSTTSVYTFLNTSNIPITFSFSSSDSPVIPEFPTTYILQSNLRGGLAFADSLNLPLTYSGYFQTGEQIYIRYGNLFGFTSANSILTLTQSISSTSSINQVILEPYVTENFELSDCNVLYGNVDSYPFNPFYMDVDYSTNGMIAVNTNQIISGSATRSTVKPYYYSLDRHIIPRYEGSKNTDRGVWEFYDNFEGSAVGYPGKLGFYSNDPNISCGFSIGDQVIITQFSGALNPSYDGIATVVAIPAISAAPGGAFITNKPFSGSGPINPGIAYLTPNTYENSNIYPLDIFNPNIFEYKYGNTTFPEIPNASMLVMGNILEVADQNNVNVLQQDSSYYEAYNKIISDAFTSNTDISDIRQYGDGKQVTLNNLKVITSDFGTPVSPLNAGDITEYWIPTSNIPSGLYGLAGNNDEELFIYSNYGAFEVQLNELNQYITGSLTPPLILINNISSSLLAGERWFITFYTASGLPNPLDKTSLQPMPLINYSFPPQFRQKGTDAQILLAARGVAEITSVRYLTGSGDGKLTYTPQSAFGEPYFGPNERGLILWKATIPSAQQGKYVIIDKPAGNNLGPGAIVPPDSNDAINQYFNKITTTYGANTKPPTN
jgi:hypothetical protein